MLLNILSTSEEFLPSDKDLLAPKRYADERTAVVKVAPVLAGHLSLAFRIVSRKDDHTEPVSLYD